MDRKNLMKVILQGEAAFLLMAFAFYLVVRNLSTIYGWIVFLAWLTFAMYVVEAAARLFKVQKGLLLWSDDNCYPVAYRIGDIHFLSNSEHYSTVNEKY